MVFANCNLRNLASGYKVNQYINTYICTLKTQIYKLSVDVRCASLILLTMLTIWLHGRTRLKRHKKIKYQLNSAEPQFFEQIKQLNKTMTIQTESYIHR